MSRVYVTTERRYLRSPEGVWVSGIEDHAFFRRYLSVFDEVVVVARVDGTDARPPGAIAASGPGVRFFDLPDFSGLAGSARALPALAQRLAALARDVDGAVVLRVPGAVSTLVWLALEASGQPFSIEVVTDPSQAYVQEALGTRLAPAIRAGALRLLRRQAATARCAAYVTREELQRLYPPASPRSFSYSSIDLPDEVFALGAATTKRLAQDAEQLAAPELIFVGHLGRPFKGLDVLLDALPLTTSAAKLTVVGDGGLRARYEEQAAALGLRDRVVFRGQLVAEGVYEAMAASDVLVLPSRREGLPRVVIEAMAVGLPCVSTSVCGARELLPEEYVVPMNDPPALAARVDDLARSREARVAASERNRAEAQRFRREHLQAERDRFYRCLLQEDRRGDAA